MQTISREESGNQELKSILTEDGLQAAFILRKACLILILVQSATGCLPSVRSDDMDADQF